MQRKNTRFPADFPSMGIIRGAPGRSCEIKQRPETRDTPHGHRRSHGVSPRPFHFPRERCDAVAGGDVEPDRMASDVGANGGSGIGGALRESLGDDQAIGGSTRGGRGGGGKRLLVGGGVVRGGRIGVVEENHEGY